MSYYRFFPLRDDYYHHGGRHHEEGIVNNLIVNVQEEYRPHLHYPFDRYYRRERSRSRSRSRERSVRGESGGSGGR
jgi:hypothetical protein